MKTLTTFNKVLLLAGFVFMAFVAVSNTDPSANTPINETEKTIRSYFKFPQVLLPHYEVKPAHTNKVEVLFTTDNNGKVNFVMAKTPDKKLKIEIEKQFSDLRLTSLKQNVVHSVILNFKVL